MSEIRSWRVYYRTRDGYFYRPVWALTRRRAKEAFIEEMRGKAFTIEKMEEEK